MAKLNAHERAILSQIRDLANEALDGKQEAIVDDAPGIPPDRFKGGCSIKSLPERLRIPASQTAVQLNPVNAPFPAGVAMGVMDPMRIAVLTSKYWGPGARQLTVSFMESASEDLKRKILGHMNAWTNIGISFVLTHGVGQVRISTRGSGYWSYLGTDILHIPTNRPTMNLQGFALNTPDSEYRRVVRHETGHTLGFPHEHMRSALVDRIDREKAYEYFWRTQRWDRATVDEQVLVSLDERSIMSTPADQTSIMCYQLPGTITTDGRPIVGGLDINSTDALFARRIYPHAGHVARAERAVEVADDDWDEAEDPEVHLDDLVTN